MAIVGENPRSYDEWLADRKGPARVKDYSLDRMDPEVDAMLRTQRCMVCHSPVAEDAVPGGTMITCVGEANGKSCRKEWWIDDERPISLRAQTRRPQARRPDDGQP